MKNYCIRFLTLLAIAIGVLTTFEAKCQTYASGAQTNNCNPAAGTAGTNGTFIGCGAGNANLGGGAQCTFIGHEAGKNNGAFSENVGVGYQSLYTQSTAAPGYSVWNVAVGNKALYKCSSTNNSPLNGAYNNAFGHAASYSCTTGSNNNAFGYYALYKNTTGYANIGIGSYAAYNCTTGVKNIAIGDSVLFLNISGHFNTGTGYKALYSATTSSLTAYGFSALEGNTSGTYNNAFGYKALTANTTGQYNNAFGYNALATATTAGYNDAFGYNTLNANTSGYGNVAMGYKTMQLNTSGSFNTSVGMQTLQSVTTGSYNAAFGFDALTYNTTASYNTATGYYSLFKNVTGAYNTASGYYSLEQDSGGFNTAIGAFSGYSNTRGTNNTFVGYYADADSIGRTNSTALGNGAIAKKNNAVYIGNTAVTTVWSAPGAWASDGRFKNNIKENVKGLPFINKLRPVTYNMDTKKLDDFIIQNMSDSAKMGHQNGLDFGPSSAIVHSGFIAQEVEIAAQEVGFVSSIVHKPASNVDHYGISYSEIVVPLVKAVQELSHKVDSLEVLLKGSNARKTQNPIEQIKNSTLNVELTNFNSVVLNQNMPNPFAEQTAITYFIPKDFSNAQILFYDSQGKLLTSVEIENSGKGSLTVFANDLTNGIYSYVLVIDGKIFDTKKMLKQ